MISPSASGLTALVYELLDAHQDTVELGAGMADDAWQAHLDYLRALQRKGREVLAKVTVSEHPGQPSEGRLR